MRSRLDTRRHDSMVYLREVFFGATKTGRWSKTWDEFRAQASELGFFGLWEAWRQSGWKRSLGPSFSGSVWRTRGEAIRTANLARRRGASRFLGVSPSGSRLLPWRVDSCNEYRGAYATEEEAARAYDRHAKAKYGRTVNFPEFPDSSNPAAV